MLDEILARLNNLSSEEFKQIEKEVLESTKEFVWFPNPGPQRKACDCLADELFYGGEAGGGKSDLEIGLALTKHLRSLLLRRTNKESLGLVERMTEILGSRDGYASQDGIWRRSDGRTIDISGCQLEEDKQKHKGKPHDLICFDEVSDFSETQYTFIIGWNRSATPGQRCRVIAAGNPPTRPEGLWVTKRWAAWLDTKHPNPAKPGELRWYTTGEDGKEIEVDGPGPHMIGNESILARSRTFIPAKLSDNYNLSADGKYASVLAGLPEELRSAYRDGNFGASLKDAPFQVIPTSWVREAQLRWKPDGFKDFQMTAMGVDPAGGGKDAEEIACRFGGWYAPIVTTQGKITEDGSISASRVVTHRRHNCPVVVDVGGGFGGGIIVRLKDNGIDAVKFNNASDSSGKTLEGGLKFANKRAEVYWRFREALNPNQEGGSVIALPEDPELVADLCAPTWELKAKGIVLESKEDLRVRLGRSPGKGDAVVMALSPGDQAIKRNINSHRSGSAPKVVMGHKSTRRT